MPTEVINEIHMGVIASPAPRITPDRLCSTAMAMKPGARMRMKRMLNCSTCS